MSVAIRRESSFGMVMLVTGCCIGAGMIGLPVLSAVSGYLPSSIAMFVSYVFTTGTGLLLLEASLWFDHKVNLLSIAQFALGKWGKIVTGGLFLSLFYAIFVAYLDAGGHLFSQILSAILRVPVSKNIGMFTSAISVSLIIYKGLRGVDWINRILMIGLLFSYVLLMALGLPHVKLENLENVNWGASLATLPILFICFGYQNLVPSLAFYMQKNVRKLRTAIIVGNMIPLLFYLLWNFTILGMLSDPEIACKSSIIVTELLNSANKSGSILYWVNAFSFFALFTSFITIAVSFVDFIRDAFQKKPHELVLHTLVLLPPLAICLSYPRLFLQALDFAGGFLDVLLFGILPVFIVWSGRYFKGAQGPYQVAGGKGFLIVLLFSCLSFLLLRALTF
jgi:tyrosine-specific transport protein